MKGKPFFSLLEGMRGAAALLVVLRHIPHLISPLIYPVTGLAVDVFFVLSGVVIANSYEDRLLTGATGFGPFVRARLIRIYPLYLVGCLVGLASLILSGELTTGQLVLASILALPMLPYPFHGAMTYPLDMPTWSLFFEFVANFAYAWFIRKASSRNLVILILASWLLLFAIGWHWGVPIEQLGWTRTTFLAGFARVAGSFFLGVLIFRVTRGQVAEARLGNLTAIAIIVAMSLTLMAPVSPRWEWQYCVVATMLVFPALVFLAVHVKPGPAVERILRLLGELSFPAYVLHVPIYQIIDVVIGHRKSPYAPWAGFAYLAVLGIAAVAINRRVDVPLRQAIQRALSPRRVAPA
jgi:peptidoglycan/LPS O-acetylase OafA/YrhL